MSQVVGSGRVRRPHHGAWLTRVGKAEKMAGLVGENGEKIEMSGQHGRIGGERRRAVHLEVCVVNLARSHVEGDRGKSEGPRIAIRPGRIVKEDDVRVSLSGVVFLLPACDRTERVADEDRRMGAVRSTRNVLPSSERLPHQVLCLGVGRKFRSVALHAEADARAFPRHGNSRRRAARERIHSARIAGGGLTKRIRHVGEERRHDESKQAEDALDHAIRSYAKAGRFGARLRSRGTPRSIMVVSSAPRAKS